MLMTTTRLIALRLFNITFGRSAFFNKILRRAMVKVLIHSRKKGEKYIASSRFFDVGELD